MEDTDYDEEDEELTKHKPSLSSLNSPIHDSSVQEVLELIMEENPSSLKSRRKSSRSGFGSVITADLELGDTEMSLVEEVDLDGTSSLEGQTIELDDGSTAFVELSEKDVDDPDNENSHKFTNGQAVQLEDGTTAFLHMSPGEGLQAVQLEDGTTAYISMSPPENLFCESMSLGNDNTSSKQSTGSSFNRTDKSSSARAIAMGNKAFKCSFSGCSKIYTTQHHLKVHERLHTGDRPYQCNASGCGKSFTTSYSLKSHVRVHTGETPYHCPEEICSKSFKTSGDLQKHIRTHTGERPFTCPFEGCERSFTTSNIRKVHIRTHTGERPYICQQDGCGRSFASATNYKNHQRIHTGEKPYMCTVPGCRRRFTEYSSLYKHHVVHTVAKPYQCNLCGRNYRQTSTLAMHKRSSHGITDLLCPLDDDPDSITTDSSVAQVEEINSSQTEKAKENTVTSISTCTTSGTPNIVLNAVSQSQIEMIMTSLNGKPGDATILTLRPQQDESNSRKDKEANSFTVHPQQILLVTDPAQLAALQQFAQQSKLGQFQPTSAFDFKSLLKTTKDTKGTSDTVFRIENSFKKICKKEK